MTTIANFTVEGPVGSGSPGGNPVLAGALDPNGNTVSHLCDPSGNLKVYVATQAAGEDVTNNVQGVIPKVIVAATYSPSSYNSLKSGSPVVEDNIKPTAGALVSLRASNANAATRYLWITNSASSPAGALASTDATVLYVLPILANSVAEIGTPFFTGAGRYCSTGISYGFSTSATSFTAGTAADHTLNANYF